MYGGGGRGKDMYGGGGRGKDMYGFDNQVNQPRSQIITDLQYKVELQLILDCMHILLHAYSKCGCHKRFCFPILALCIEIHRNIVI